MDKPTPENLTADLRKLFGTDELPAVIERPGFPKDYQTLPEFVAYAEQQKRWDWIKTQGSPHPAVPHGFTIDMWKHNMTDAQLIEAGRPDLVRAEPT